MKFSEINLRFIDAHGDCIDVNGPFSNATDARNSLGTLPSDTVAWVIERTFRYTPSSGRCNVHKILERGGNAEALALGGWDN
jgi:hypothetical protein